MGNDESRRRNPDGAAHHRRFSHGLISNFGASVVHRLSRRGPFSQTVQLPVTNTSSSTHEDNNPQSSVSPFLPEFPLRKFPGKNQFQVLGFIAKGSFGPILKIKDVSIDKIFAIKVSPKTAILNHGALDQSKDEVIIQRQLKHPFIHNLQDCWQTQHHLFIMCDYCGMGDLYTCWLLQDRFEEEDIRLFAAEMASALGFLNDLGIMHRDIKMDNILLSDRGHLRLSDFGLSRRLKRGGRTFTICGTIQYMAPEVLGGGPYNHAADWWSLGVMLYCLATGEFPVPPESGHIAMLNKVRQCPYVIPSTCSTALTILLTELLSKNPVNRLRNLDCFQMQAFFRGTSFDSEILQKTPNEVILKLRTHPDWSAKAMRGITVDYLKNFDHNKVHSPTYLSQGSPSLANKDMAL
ncbi:ribosomal protein S6 kinase-related protein isoform X1 [Periophthalmus magnuspinnatus]|uniref:ribosomal protein S6 kinase-related protein isoform X1 n=1 Tax=Periophthalmus magnuspinnatus TaxID=409849 RepID=UPI002436EC9D|nr:ribosomal protein S6 kinase-related protein isoform X1 [Periophthalmus magnuspinnatus]